MPPQADPTGEIRNGLHQTDHLAPFRKLILLCVVFGFPLLGYALLFGTLRAMAHVLFDRPTASLIASGLCLVAGLGCFVPVLALHAGEPVPADRYADVLQSEEPADRIRALRLMQKNRFAFPQSDTAKIHLASPLAAERYWTLAALSQHPGRQSLDQALPHLADPQINVACKAVQAVASSPRNPAQRQVAITEIRKVLQASDHWYLQWYAMRALRRLGPVEKRP